MAARKRKPAGHGGARKGAGRKPTGAALGQITVSVDRAKLRELAELLGVSEAEAVRQAVERHLGWLAGSPRVGPERSPGTANSSGRPADQEGGLLMQPPTIRLCASCGRPAVYRFANGCASCAQQLESPLFIPFEPQKSATVTPPASDTPAHETPRTRAR